MFFFLMHSIIASKCRESVVDWVSERSCESVPDYAICGHTRSRKGNRFGIYALCGRGKAESSCKHAIYGYMWAGKRRCKKEKHEGGRRSRRSKKEEVEGVRRSKGGVSVARFT